MHLGVKYNLSNQHIYACTRKVDLQVQIAECMEAHMQEALDSNKAKIISSMNMINFLI